MWVTYLIWHQVIKMVAKFLKLIKVNISGEGINTYKDFFFSPSDPAGYECSLAPQLML